MRPRSLGLRLAATVLFPLGAAGCDLPGALTSDDKEAVTAAKPPADSWILVEKGDPPKSEPRPAAPPVKKEEPHGFPHAAPHEAVKTLDPRCVGNTPAGTIAPMTVTPGAGSATVRWYHPGDRSVVTYHLTSFSQKAVAGQQPALKWQEVKPGHGCREITATVKGLQRDTPYVFSVDAVRTATWTNTTRRSTVARSGVVSTR